MHRDRVGRIPFSRCCWPAHLTIADEVDHHETGIDVVAPQPPEMGDPIGKLIEELIPGRVTGTRFQVCRYFVERSLDQASGMLGCLTARTAHLGNMGLGLDQQDVAGI